MDGCWFEIFAAKSGIQFEEIVQGDPVNQNPKVCATKAKKHALRCRIQPTTKRLDDHEWEKDMAQRAGAVRGAGAGGFGGCWSGAAKG